MTKKQMRAAFREATNLYNLIGSTLEKAIETDAKMSSKIVLISDVHGQTAWYADIIKDYEFTVQLGDLNFDYKFFEQNNIDHTKHVFIHGNHDNIDKLECANTTPKNYLGRYGFKTLNDVEFFYVSGGFSIDKKYRTPYIDWWPNEELSDSEFKNCYELYCDIKPKIVFSHECPRFISNIIGNPDILRDFGFNPDTFTTRTSQWLQKMYTAWQPKLWIYGHYHRHHDFYHNIHFPKDKYDYQMDKLSFDYRTTRFICLPDLFRGRKQVFVKVDNNANVEYIV